VVSMASARVMAGRMVVSHRASLDMSAARGAELMDPRTFYTDLNSFIRKIWR
jgi:hypothetical protein